MNSENPKKFPLVSFLLLTWFQQTQIAIKEQVRNNIQYEIPY
jgi:hypothetical protein